MDSDSMSDYHSRSHCIYLYQKKKAWILDSKQFISLDSSGDYIELSYLLGRVSSYNEGRETIRSGTRYKPRRIYG